MKITKKYGKKWKKDKDDEELSTAVEREEVEESEKRVTNSR